MSHSTWGLVTCVVVNWNTFTFVEFNVSVVLVFSASRQTHTRALWCPRIADIPCKCPCAVASSFIRYSTYTHRCSTSASWSHLPVYSDQSRLFRLLRWPSYFSVGCHVILTLFKGYTEQHRRNTFEVRVEQKLWENERNLTSGLNLPREAYLQVEIQITRLVGVVRKQISA